MKNLQKELDFIIENLEYRPKLLLHACCAPCASYPVEYLREHFDLGVFYFNPNIESLDEYKLRGAEVKRMCDFFKVDLISKEWGNERFMQLVKGFENEKEGGSRCDLCFKLRLSETALVAKKLDFEYFTTSLSISPLKNSQKLFEIGEKLGEDTGIRYLPSDFKKKEGYKRATQISKELSLYRQNYCGCIFSKNQRLLKVDTL